MKISILGTFLAGLIFLHLPAVHAEESSAGPTPLWAGSAELSLAITTGNSETQSTGLGLELLYSPELWRYKAKGSYLNSTNQNVLSAEIYNGELRGARKLSDSLDAFAQGAAFKNVFAGFKSRFGADAGLGYRIFDGPEHILRAEVGGGFVTESRVDDTRNNFGVGKVAASYDWKVSKTADLTEELAYTHDFKNSSDWRFNNQLGVSAKITEIMSLKITHRTEYLNLPVAGKRNTDTALASALVAKF